jgi:hypothetical protein
MSVTIDNDVYNIKLANFDKQNFINSEISSRNFPSSGLTMNFSFRPVNTKYTFMPTVAPLVKSVEPIVNYNNYDTSSVFFPGTRKMHYCGFASNVDRESTLRNQFFALQKADQKAYIPPSTSDLYENNINFAPKNENLDSHLLFREQQFQDFNPNRFSTIGNELFYNSTRVQLKNIK